MGSIKSVGGLTRGCGFEESTSVIWLLSMPAYGEVHRAMQEVTGLSSYGAGEIHKDLTQAKLMCDAKDLHSIIDYFEARKSMNTNELQTLSSGVIADGLFNVDSAETVGAAILVAMEGVSVCFKPQIREKTTGF